MRPARHRRQGRGLSEILGHWRHRLFRPEAEFFLFDDVRYSVTPQKVSFEIDAVDAAWNTDTAYEDGNLAHRAPHKGGYFPVNPIDTAQDIRGEMLSTMKRMGIKVDKHHHEVATCQHELGMILAGWSSRPTISRNTNVIHNVAAAYGKSVTFMPKPMKGDNGSGMHVNMSIWKDGKPLFAGRQICGPVARGAVFHRRHPQARESPERAHEPGDQQLQAARSPASRPRPYAYSARNRSGCVRIPWTESPKAKRVEARFPDPLRAGRQDGLASAGAIDARGERGDGACRGEIRRSG